MNNKINWNRIWYASLGFTLGVVVSPLAILVTPFFFAYWLYIYGDED